MIDKFFKLYKKYRELITYVITGGFTTLVYFIAYAICKFFGAHYEVSTCIAWIAAVLFAFITNKIVVFRMTNKKGTLAEFLKFVSARLATLGIDMLFTFLLISVMSLNEWLSKVLVQVIIMILNYVFSKVFVFRKKQTP
ncbi:MAG: GtrA family protein [Eubacteriaceae bacterium]|nr:GtrA family protein [Eubacteriaceae bacterium]